MSGISCIQGLLAEVSNFFGAPAMNHLRGEESETGMLMLGVVPREELLAEAPGMEQRTETGPGNSGRYFRVLNLALGERIVV